MSLADEYKVLERRYLSARQQIEKLQSNVRILKSSNDDLADRAEALQKDAKEYKKAFDEIFIHNVGASWDNIPPQERESMGIKDKIEFYKRETSNTQAYMKKSFYEFQGGAHKEVEALKKKVEELQRDLHQKEAVLAETKAAAKPKATDTFANKGWMNGGKSEDKPSQPNASRSEGSQPTGGRRPVATSFSFNKDNIKKHTNRFSKGGESKPQPSDKADILKNIASSNPQEEAEKQATKEQATTSEQKTAQPKAASQPKTRPMPKSAPKTEKKAEPAETKKENLDAANPSPSFFSSSSFNGKSKLLQMTKQEQAKTAASVAPFLKGNSALKEKPLFILYVIGTTGLFAQKDIISEMKGGNPELGFSPFTKNSCTEFISPLCNAGILWSQPMKTAGKGRPTNAYLLTDLGKWLYFFKFRQDPADSLLYKIGKDQKSLAHGADIMLLVNNLEAKGYKCTQEVAGNTDEGDSISDILAVKGNFSYYIEYEEGNYPESGYDQKFRRINKLQRNVIFVTKDKKTAAKIEGFYKNFLADEENAEYRDKFAAFFSFADFQGDKDPLSKLH